MRIWALIKTAVRSILKNRMRSILTSLGIVIGVSVVIIMVAIGEGTRAQVSGEVSSLGSNLLMVIPGVGTAGGVRLGSGSIKTLTIDDVEKIEEEAGSISAISPVVIVPAQVVGGGANWSTSVVGVSLDYLTIRNWEVEKGTFFTEKDISKKKKVAVLGKTVVDELFPSTDPIGKKIRIGKIPFLVLGVMKEKGQTGMGQEQDDAILAPWPTVLYRMKGGRNTDMIAISAGSNDSLDVAEEEITSILRNSHRLSDGEDDDFRIINQAEILDKVGQVTGILTAVLGAVAAVSLVVGGIGIMNIMLVSVTERTREIGIRLSVGAKKRDILVQFLVEALVLSLIGGMLGTVIAVAISQALTEFIGLETVIESGTVMLSLLFAGAVGIFFGYYPARKAASLNPIEALRYE
jgi:putative ABC transport system permease protein